MQTFTTNSGLSEVTPPVAVVSGITPAMVLNVGLLQSSVPVTEDEVSVGGEFPEEWEDTAPSRCSPLDDF